MSLALDLQPFYPRISAQNSRHEAVSSALNFPCSKIHPIQKLKVQMVPIRRLELRLNLMIFLSPFLACIQILDLFPSLVHFFRIFRSKLHDTFFVPASSEPFQAELFLIATASAISRPRKSILWSEPVYKDIRNVVD